MRRQVGADAIDFDMEEGFAHYAVLRPSRIDFAVLEQALYGAGYTLADACFEFTGTAERARCDACDRETLQVVIDGTGQRFDLDGADVPVGRRLRVRVRAVGWDGGHPRMTLLEFEDA